MHAFFGLGDDVDFNCIDCHLVSGSYINIQVPSQVIIEFNKSGLFSMRCKRSKHNSLQHSFFFIWQHFWNHFCTNLSRVQFTLRIRRTLSVSGLTSSDTVRTPNLWSFRITSRSFSMLLSVTAVCGQPGWSLSFKLSLPSENCLCHSNTRARDMQSSP